MLTAQAKIAAGRQREHVAAELHTEATRLKRLFDIHGRLLVSPSAATMLKSASGEQFARLERALSPADEKILERLKRQRAHAPLTDLRRSCIEVRMSPVAMTHLFDEAGRLRPEVVQGLPDRQRALLQAISAPAAECPPEPPSAPPGEAEHVQLVQMQALLSASVGWRTDPAARPQSMAAAIGLPPDVASQTFTAEGRLLVATTTEPLLRGPALEMFATMPRALTTEDEDILKQVKKAKESVFLPSLQHACVQAGMTAPAVAYLFNRHERLRMDRVATLPEHQQELLRLVDATVGRRRLQPTTADERHKLLAMRAMLVARAADRESHQINQSEMARATGLGIDVVKKTFDSRGQLLVASTNDRLLVGPGAEVFEALPRALRFKDLDILARQLRQHALTPALDVFWGCTEAGMDLAARTYLFDAEGCLLEDRLATLPEEQRQVLESAGNPSHAMPPAIRHGIVKSSAPRLNLQSTGASSSGMPPRGRAGPNVREVLGYFHDQTSSPRAFTDALSRFALSRAEMLHFLASVGVTEAEASSGAIPSAETLWNRLVGASRPGAAASSPSESGDFVASLEALMDADSPPTVGAKRVASQALTPPPATRPRQEPFSYAEGAGTEGLQWSHRRARSQRQAGASAQPALARPVPTEEEVWDFSALPMPSDADLADIARGMFSLPEPPRPGAPPPRQEPLDEDNPELGDTFDWLEQLIDLPEQRAPGGAESSGSRET